MGRLWDKGEATDELVLRFTVGQDYVLDERLVAYDVQASVAHARMLARCGYLSEADADALAQALQEILAEHQAGAWSITLEEEDCHTALESRLTERLPELGGRIHLGRSRNDQVLAALRLYLLDAVDSLKDLGQKVCESLAEIERRQGTIALPGYTHMQRAMPSTVALWASGFRSEIEDDLHGLDACKRRLLRNPLGSAAGYGVPVLELRREETTNQLPFTSTHEPVTAVQLSRGKGEASVLFEIALLMQDVGRISADLCLFATQEYGFVKLPQAFTTGSSIMPQKRNPDVFELVRARSAQFPAELQSVLSLTSKLTSGYHRDLQLIKEPLFRALDRAADVLIVMSRALAGVTFDPVRTSSAMDASLFATEKAYQLVKDEGIPFREAYRRVARDFP
jgi:argininosuccinate lyase